jgi:bifunctional DNA-binding transcriptional regulator/antitoxin component of YhaV-PrlF toxin-antitoxin module
MPLVTVKPKHQVTIPTPARKQTGLGVGDLLEAKVERGNIGGRQNTSATRAASAHRSSREIRHASLISASPLASPNHRRAILSYPRSCAQTFRAS